MWLCLPVRAESIFGVCLKNSFRMFFSMRGNCFSGTLNVLIEATVRILNSYLMEEILS